MSSAARPGSNAPIASWVAQMVGTLVIAGVVLAFVKSFGAPLSSSGYEWQRYMMGAILAAAFPSLLYLRKFKRRLNADEAAVKASGAPDPDLRRALMRSLAIGGALCELPMALGMVHLFLGGETRWFLYATLITIAVRLSYRPFNRPPR